MPIEKGIPEKDLKAINDSFKADGKVETIGKNVKGQRVSAKKIIVNDKSYTFKDFSNKILRHQKSIFYPGQGMVIIGVKGDKWSNIPVEKRNLVQWFDSDFE